MAYSTLRRSSETAVLLIYSSQREMAFTGGHASAVDECIFITSYWPIVRKWWWAREKMAASRGYRIADVRSGTVAQNKFQFVCNSCHALQNSNSLLHYLLLGSARAV